MYVYYSSASTLIINFNLIKLAALEEVVRVDEAKHDRKKTRRGRFGDHSLGNPIVKPDGMNNIGEPAPSVTNNIGEPDIDVNDTGDSEKLDDESKKLRKQRKLQRSTKKKPTKEKALQSKKFRS